MLHHACQTKPESMQTVKMCNVSKQSTTAHQSTTSHQSTTAHQAKAKSIPSTTQPSPIPKQYCRNYQTKLRNAEETIVNSYMKLILVQNQ